MTDKKVLIKRKLCSVIEEATQLSVLDDRERKLHTDTLEVLLATIDAELDVIDGVVKKRLVEKKDQEEQMMLQKIRLMTTKDFPKLVPKLADLKFAFQCTGLLWTEGLSEECLARDYNGHCDNDDHDPSYHDELDINNQNTGKFVYKHTIDCSAHEIDHGDDTVQVSVDLRASLKFEIDYDFTTLADTETEFLKWACEVHKLFYSARARLNNSDGHVYTDELKHILYGKLLEDEEEEGEVKDEKK